ncbi:MAG: SDR family NAD(P)-dependent oxidoreductase [Clostridia bacterium]|nr:SDR family NAD(P)-dependent oxidoreductase [Clostridia bacterium]
MKKVFSLSISKENPIVKNHTVNGEALLPGLAYIDMLYQLAKQGLETGITGLCLKHMTIYSPLIVREGSPVQIRITFTKKSQAWSISVEGSETGAQQDPSESRLYAAAELHENAVLKKQQIDILGLKRSAKECIDLESVYGEAGKRGLKHQGVIKAKGCIYVIDSGCLVELCIDENQYKSMDTLFHPALIDGAAMAASVLADSNSSDNSELFIPLYYESFSGRELLQTHCYALVDTSSIQTANDIRKLDINFFNLEGELVAELKEITTKQIRSKGQASQGKGMGESRISDSIEEILRKIFAGYIKKKDSDIDLDTVFFELGLESAQLLFIVKDIENALGLSLNPTLLFENSNLQELIKYLEQKIAMKEFSSPITEINQKEVFKPANNNGTLASDTFIFYEDEAYLRDHLVFGKPALMGVTHPCLALEAYLRQNPGALPVGLKNIQFIGGPVTLEKKEKVHVRVRFCGDSNQTTFSTEYYITHPKESKPCCSGKCIKPVEVPGKVIDIYSMIKESKTVDDETINKSYHIVKNFKVGPMLQNVEAAYRYGENTLISKIGLANKLKKGDISRFTFDPLLLNCCYLGIADEDNKKTDNILVPLMIERLTVFREMTEDAYVINTIRSKRDGFISIDAVVLTDMGEIIAEISNASLREVMNPSMLHNAVFDSDVLAEKVSSDESGSDGRPRIAEGLDIAIVGISGRYPQAYDVNEFWHNLREGKDCITEIPEDRWDWKEYYSEDRKSTGNIYSKWGGFIDDMDKFDPGFFNISPREAEFLDPQERLFLEHCWMAMEDAGYTRQGLQKGQETDMPGSVGVYAGVMYQEYPLYAAEATLKGQPMGLAAGISSIATRVSYFCNFHGPSIALDTMCSGSLTSIYLACQALKDKRIDAALAGGVNLTIHPNKYLMLSQGQFISSKGHCESFGIGGDGYIPGEGVGVLMLKRLSDAKRDKDHIYGVIKGIAVNHGGKSSGYTVPNPKAQRMVITQALEEAGFDPRTISYIEAHGTGTKLGDPIEISALTEAFGNFTDDKQFCMIGSVKSNIGHCESAAGVAGVIKVLLQMKHGKIVPSLHSSILNPNIDFNATPFMVNQKLVDWKRPTVEGTEQPLRAGISSFGASGLNAHMVIEEYQPEGVQDYITINAQNPAAIVLSARNRERLTEQVERLLHAIKEKKLTNASLADLAYTLQTGREAMEERLALIVSSIKELEDKLLDFLKGKGNIDMLYHGQSKKNNDSVSLFTVDEDLQEAVNKWIEKRKYTKLLSLWVKGLSFDWDMLYGSTKPYKLSLPTYPFAKERYWVHQTRSSENNLKESVIHPLVHKNTSDISELKFTSSFSGKEFFLTDHVVRGKKVLPGAAYLEMAREALERAGVGKEGRAGLRMKNVVWVQPVTVEEQPVELHIGLYPDSDGGIAFDIYSFTEENGAESIVHSQGTGMPGGAVEIPNLDIKALLGQFTESIDASRCYQVLENMGIEYGPGHRGIDKIYLGNNQVLAKIFLPSSVSGTKDQYVLHPSIIDSALQASVGLVLGSGSSRPSLPFALEELEIFGSCTPEMWALISYQTNMQAGENLHKLDIDLCNEDGEICLRLKGYTSRLLNDGTDSSDSSAKTGTVLFQPYWKECADIIENPVNKCMQRFVALCEPEGINMENFKSQMSGVNCIILQSEQEAIEERFNTYAVRLFEEIQCILKNKPKDKILIQVIISGQKDKQLLSGLSGLLRTAQLENPLLTGQLIEVEAWENSEVIAGKLMDSSLCPDDHRIRYQEGKRWVLDWREAEASQNLPPIPWKDGCLYLIAGGSGDLGMIFAAEIARQVRTPTLILTGRSPLSKEKQDKLAELEAKGARVIYRQVDIAEKQAVDALFQNIREDFGSLHGIIHSAGVTKDNFIIKKNSKEFSEVLAPKVKGLVNLDKGSKDMSLDFFILFSSGAGAMGNIGQADYASANGFMDAYAAYRNELAGANERHGRTLTINWPLWEDGGMYVDEATQKMWQNLGMSAIKTSAGIQAFYRSFDSGTDQVLVVEGDVSRLRRIFKGQSYGDEVTVTSPYAKKEQEGTEIAQDLLQEQAINYFKSLLSSIIKLPASQIEADAPMEKYGIDSVMVMHMTNRLEESFGSLSKTLFFEYQNIRDLTGYFLENHHQQLVSLVGIKQKDLLAGMNGPNSLTGLLKPVAGRRQRSNFVSLSDTRKEERPDRALDIAIIGVAGRYPQARNQQEFWNNLSGGRDCITEIPRERWDYSLYPGQNKNETDKTYSKWGGFLDDADKFDPYFFNISPREAEIMDPQERLFLQCVYETLEDAGYTREPLNKCQGSGMEGNVGVFVGVMYEEYQLYGAQEQILGKPVVLPGNPSSIANRISYFFNLHGPSMAIDTMCSSSLTAIHLACQSLQQGGCELAVAGGVNVSIHPNKYLLLGQGNFLSSRGRCESFGRDGDGYVPGEGVGAVLLKPLAEAIKDNNQIYGVIKGSAINHGGKTNGYSVPNPNAQANVIAQAVKSAGIDPRAISYLEAHGTGTSLGDPIEITALSKVFRKYTPDKEFCAIGSVKSNIGHCESAAGIAGVTKVLLQLKYQQLVPSLHSEVLNPNIDFADTPFIVQQKLQQWKRPVLQINGIKREYPRIAGISSFGAGGSNAHIIIEEYIPGSQSEASNLTEQSLALDQPVIILLSARNMEQLREQAKQLLEYVIEQKYSDHLLADVAYTLQVGREAMEERMAVVVSSFEDLQEKLREFVEGKESIDDFYLGQVNKNSDSVALLNSDKDLQDDIDIFFTERKYDKLLNLWVNGLKCDWNKLYGAVKPRIMSLPTYPFARKRCWAPQIDHRSSNSYANPIHPMVHKNTSRFSEIRFTSSFTGNEFFLFDHVVKGNRIFPGVAYLEMVIAAAMEAAGLSPEDGAGINLENIVWIRPIAVQDHPVEIHIGLSLQNDGDVQYQIYSEDIEMKSQKIVYSQGTVTFDSKRSVSSLDLKKLLAQSTLQTADPDQYYKVFEEMGINYGPGYRGIKEVYAGANHILARLSLPPALSDTLEHFTLHPSLLDSAVQASIALNRKGDDSGKFLKPALAFSLKKLEVAGKCTSKVWALIKPGEKSQSAEIQNLDIDLCNEKGVVLVRMQGLTTRTFEEKTPAEINTNGALTGNITLMPVWDPIQIKQDQKPSVREGCTVIIGCNQDAEKLIKQCYPDAHLLKIGAFDTTEEIPKKLQAYGLIGHIIWIAQNKQIESVTSDEVIDGQNQGVIFCFRVIKALLSLGYGTRELSWSVITTQCQPVYKNETVNPVNASLHGLIGTMSKEYPGWKTSIIDLEENCDWPVPEIFTIPAELYGESLAYRGRMWYKQRLINADLPSEMKTVYKTEGVYIVIGGAGGLGEVWSEYMLRSYRARIVWIGRRPIDEQIQAKLDKLAALGPAPIYISADASDKNSLEHAYMEIKQIYHRINGVIHAAVGAMDQSLTIMEEKLFREGLSAKVDLSVYLAQVFGKEPLDFIIFFSSLAAFSKDHGKSSYCSGSVFEDAFAHQLAQEWTCIVKVMNWGYWGDVGIGGAIPEAFKKRLIKAGTGHIDPEGAMIALEKLLAGPVNQMALINTTKPINTKDIPDETILVYQAGVSSNIGKIQRYMPLRDEMVEKIKLEMGMIS